MSVHAHRGRDVCSWCVCECTGWTDLGWCCPSFNTKPLQGISKHQGISKQHFPEFPIDSMGVDVAKYNIKILKTTILVSKILAFSLSPPGFFLQLKWKYLCNKRFCINRLWIMELLTSKNRHYSNLFQINSWQSSSNRDKHCSYNDLPHDLALEVPSKVKNSTFKQEKVLILIPKIMFL